ncbi:DNA-formamidopyrimidine glycosylase [candidate division WWE3 bacterium RBG_13_37_7]|uniref:DNA-formamidopyrimidine glycosylase n=1 Tax=candidate division WWE3 bacterium RBG_13_37_7 TaxID=1802609 RepID=A0A1F4U3J0_UNCKA|nr:MAG: DNA-formamidopyrimidine glycosylase [candidate division WWE3 bacterium RBG_13_37_7]
MPELPEVHTIAKDLNDAIMGFSVKKCVISSGYKTQPNNAVFIKAIEGSKITKVQRIAKNILIHLENGAVIHFHLAMTGQILLKTQKLAKKSNQNWQRILLELEKNGGKKFLIFNDMRMFGKAAVLKHTDLKALQQKYGPEPIDSEMQPEKLWEVIRSKKTTIKNALLNQSLIAGLGNIYATEALFLAGIHPETPTDKISLENMKKLINAAKTVLEEGITHRGSTLPDKMYMDIFGNSGHYQEHFKIYLQTVCPKCGNKVAFKKINGRGTYFCPICQPINQQKGLF